MSARPVKRYENVRQKRLMNGANITLHMFAPKNTTKEFGGKVFYIFSTKVNGKKEIVNTDVVNDLTAEIKRLS